MFPLTGDSAMMQQVQYRQSKAYRMRRLLVTGVSGLLGWNICRNLPPGEWELFGICFRNRVSVSGITVLKKDLGDPREIEALFQDVRPDAVIHAAAISDAEYCETHGSGSFAINVEASVSLAHLCRKRSIPYVFTSSDLVFDGMNPPYREDDPVCPISCYGRQKVEAEQRILETYPDAAICRMPLMFGIPGSGSKSILTMIEAMRKGMPLRLFVDEYRTPLHAGAAAAGIMMALHAVHGVVHLGGPDRISRFGLGKLIAEVFGEREALLVGCRQRDTATSAPRPPDVSMDSSRAFELGFRPASLRDQIRELFSEFSRKG
jgi:dTDP-4-dehydrorhamnose reductase